MRFVSLITLIIVILPTDMLAAEYFREDWSDGNDKDGSPVSWTSTPFESGTFEIIGGDYVAQADDPLNELEATGAIAVGQSFEDIAIEIQGSVSAGRFWASARTDGNTGYIGGTDDVGWFGIHRLMPGPTRTERVLVRGGLTPVTALEDIKLEFQLVGDQLSLRSWAADGERPFLPQMTATDDTFDAGSVGLAYSEKDNQGGVGTFQSFEVYEPKNYVGNRNAISFSEVPSPLPNDLPIVFDVSEHGVDQIRYAGNSLDLNSATIEINGLGGLPAFGEYQLIDVETITGDATIVMSEELETNVLVDRLLTEGILEIRSDVLPDCNGDGMFDVFDLNCFEASQTDDLLNQLGLIRGDADGNGKVEFADFTKLANNYGKRGQYTDGDFNKDGMVLFADFLILSNNFDQGASEVASVPEPSSGWLLLSVIICLVRRLGIHTAKTHSNRSPWPR